ncbi:hypothetical protein BDP27DRAFT_1329930 [Rhodocollybia butyracea]|uniref:RRM domain-containing protein n=1 Tax=Rhodocollybia butyracea TaxID=206335 RepID=A0A9P5PRY6_9AGAR|nr:hypothetical protein BDP27DRAFT_1329930 [Rhodocollybia butyracea]
MDLDADLYGDLYETDITGPDENPLHSPQTPKAEVTNEEPPENTTSSTALPSATAASLTSAYYASVSQQQSTPAAMAPPVQQIPTYEDPTTASYRDTDLAQQGGYDQDFSGQDHRSIRPSEMKDDGKMFIGGLSWNTTDDGLRAYFEQFGKVEQSVIMRDPQGRSRCFAFLTFEDPASVNAVMVKEHVLDGKIIDPKRAIPRQEHQRATKLFIGGLAGTVTSESMKEFFSQFGKVVDSTVMLDRETGRSKGFGFISLEDANVQQFLGFGHLEIDGKLIDVKLAQPRYQRETFQEDEQTYTSPRVGGAGRGLNNFVAGSSGNGPGFANNVGGVGGAVSASGAPFDPQALAALYTRMFQMANGGAMNAMMNNGMNVGMNPMVNMGGNVPGGAGGGAMGMGAGRGVPRGPRGGSGGMGAAGVGPSRPQRGQHNHNYHPYGR